jgi:DNA-binding NarL/FixJ family response regulator
MKKVLVVDDDPQLRSNLLDMLIFEGYEALGAENGQEGIRVAHEQLPDLVICDICLFWMGLAWSRGCARVHKLAIFPSPSCPAKETKLSSRKDYNRAQLPSSPDLITCPMCSTQFGHNSTIERSAASLIVFDRGAFLAALISPNVVLVVPSSTSRRSICVPCL